MQAYKVKGQIDETGRLIVTEAIALAPGEVEVIVLQPSSTEATELSSDLDSESVQGTNCQIPALKRWLEQAPSVPPDYDPEQAKWEYLKEKHNL